MASHPNVTVLSLGWGVPTAVDSRGSFLPRHAA